MSTLDLNTARASQAFPFIADLFGRFKTSMANSFYRHQTARLISVMNQMTDAQLVAVNVERAGIPAHVGRILPRT